MPGAVRGRHDPAAALLVEHRGGDRRFELDVLAQVEPIGDVLEVAEELGLARIALTPRPLLLKLVRERVGVVDALDVAACARIAVPVPGAADSRCRLEDARAHSELPEAIERVQAGEACTRRRSRRTRRADTDGRPGGSLRSCLAGCSTDRGADLGHGRIGALHDVDHSEERVNLVIESSDFDGNACGLELGCIREALVAEWVVLGDDTIEGINVVFGSDDSQLQQSLGRTNKELNATAKLGKEVDKSLKWDPLSIDNMNDSLEVTEKQLTLTKAKSKALTGEMERLSALDLDTLNTSLTSMKKDLEENKKETQSLEKEMKKLEDSGDIDSTAYKQMAETVRTLKIEEQQLNKEIKATQVDINKLDSVAYTNLTTEAKATQVEVDRLQRKQKSLNKDVDALNSENYDDLSKGAKKAAKEQGLLADEIEDTTDSNDDFTSSLGGLASTGATQVMDDFASSLGPVGEQAASDAGNIISMGASMAGLGPAGVAAGVGIGIATTAISKNIREASLDREATKDLTYAYGDNEDAAKDNADAVTALSKAYNKDQTEVIEANKSTKAYTSSLDSAETQISNTSNAIGIAESGLLDYDQQMALTTSAQRNWNLSANDTEKVLGTTTTLMQEYGTVMEDLPDTIIEWSDTFSAAGIDAEEFFTILEDGAKAGARSTDETANALNEFVISMEEAQDPTSAEAQALDDLGISFGDLTDTIQNEGITAGISDVLNEMANLTDTQAELNQLMTISGALFGTVGEEFVYNAVVAGDLGKATEDLSGATTWLNTQSGILGKTLETNKSKLSPTEYDTLNTALSNLNVTTFLLNDTIFTQSIPALQKLVDQGVITQTQMDLLTNSQNILSGALEAGSITTLLTDANTKILTDTMFAYQDQLGLTDEQVEKYSGALSRGNEASYLLNLTTGGLTNALFKQAGTLGYNIDKSKTFTVASYEQANGAQTVKTTTEELTVAEMTRAQKLTLLNGAMSKTTLDQDKMKASLKILTDESATSSEKIGALQTTLNGLSEATITNSGDMLINAEQAGNLQGQIDSLNTIQGKGEQSAANYAESIGKTTTEYDEGADGARDFGQALEDSSVSFGKYEDKAIDSMEATKDLNNEVKYFNDHPPENQTVTITTKYETKGTPPADTTGATQTTTTSKAATRLFIPQEQQVARTGYQSPQMYQGGTQAQPASSQMRFDGAVFNITANNPTELFESIRVEMAKYL